MIIGMGTRNNQSRIPRPIFLLSSRARARTSPVISLALLFLQCIPDSVLGAAHGVLHLPCRFFRGPFGLRFGVAGHLADSLLHRTLYLMSGTHNAIFVHGYSPGLFTTNTPFASKVREAGSMIRFTSSS